jgi:hypothetical protein
MAGTGLAPDARQIIARARSECSQYLSFYGDRISAQILADRMARHSPLAAAVCVPVHYDATAAAATARPPHA